MVTVRTGRSRTGGTAERCEQTVTFGKNGEEGSESGKDMVGEQRHAPGGGRERIDGMRQEERRWESGGLWTEHEMLKKKYRRYHTAHPYGDTPRWVLLDRLG